MDLKERKFILNARTAENLPKFDNGLLSENQAKSIISGATGLLNFGAQMSNAGSYNKSQTDLNMQAGQSQSSTGGYGYQIQNVVDQQRESQEVDSQNTQTTLGLTTAGMGTGAAIGSLAGPVGTVVGGLIGGAAGFVGGLFGGKSRKRKMEEALRKQRYEASLKTEFNREKANTKRLSDVYAYENGDPTSQYLNTGFMKGKQPVYSPFGLINAEPDSKVSKGEVAIDTLTGSRYRIPTGPNDTALFAGGKNPYTAIITNKYGLSDIAMKDPETAIALQGALKENGMLGRNKQGYKNGKLPKFDEGDQPLLPMLNINKGEIFKYPDANKIYEDFSKKNITPKSNGVELDWLPNVISSGLGILAGYNQYASAKRQSPYKPNTYVSNPYSGRANSILAGLRPNELPIINAILKEKDAANYRLDNSGSLTTAQKYLGRIATARNSQANIYNALANLQNIHNQYRSTYANSLLNQGSREAANQMTAMRADNDTYMRSHAARQQGMQTGIQNMLAQLQQGMANEEKRRMFNKMYGLYAA